MAQDAVRSEGEHRPVTILCCVDSRLEPRQFVPTGAAHVWYYRNAGGRGTTTPGGGRAPPPCLFFGCADTPTRTEPHPPPPRGGRGIGEGIAGDEEEVRGAAFNVAPGFRFFKEIPATNRRGS